MYSPLASPVIRTLVQVLGGCNSKGLTRNRKRTDVALGEISIISVENRLDKVHPMLDNLANIFSIFGSNLGILMYHRTEQNRSTSSLRFAQSILTNNMSDNSPSGLLLRFPHLNHASLCREQLHLLLLQGVNGDIAVLKGPCKHFLLWPTRGFLVYNINHIFTISIPCKDVGYMHAMIHIYVSCRNTVVYKCKAVFARTVISGHHGDLALCRAGRSQPLVCATYPAYDDL
ncbi:unnamed protein product [Ixodes pacificus]